MRRSLESPSRSHNLDISNDPEGISSYADTPKSFKEHMAGLEKSHGALRDLIDSLPELEEPDNPNNIVAINADDEREQKIAEARNSVLKAFNKEAGNANSENQKETTQSAELIKERVVDMTTAPDEILSADFKSGVYLFHSAKVKGIENIFKSGEILNAGEIYERTLAQKRKELESQGKSDEEIESELKKVMISRNSGQEGISWSANGIDAMPGTSGRIAGFVAAPELVLKDSKLVIPSRPAPYELLQVSNNLNTKEFFKTKKQSEVWGYGTWSLGEQATVESGLMRLIMNVENGDQPDKFGFYKSLLKDFGENSQLTADDLRKHFEISEDGHIKLDENLHQQKFDENYLPPAAVYIQAIVDQGTFKDTPLEGKTALDVINSCKTYNQLPKFLFSHSRQEGKRYSEAYEAELNQAAAVNAKVEDMYFVTSHKDLDGWIKIMQETGHIPKGILLYDDTKIVNENFASDQPGDHAEMANEIGRVIGADKNFWSTKIGIDPERIERTGSKGQVLKDSEVSHDTEIKIISNNLEVTTA